MGCGVKIRLSDGSGTIDLNNLYSDRDRHGNTRFYYRSRGKKTRLRETVGTPQFLDEYRRARAGTEPVEKVTAAPQTLRWLVEQYYKSAAYMGLAADTRTMRRRALDRLCESLQGSTPRGQLPFAQMQRKHVIQIRDERAETPEAAKNLLKFIRHMFNWALDAGHADDNPALNIRNLASTSEGHHTWTVAEIEQYCRAHPIGTKPRLALELLLFTGVRVSDVVTLGKQMERDGWLYFTEAKNAARAPKRRELPILPRLRRSLNSTPSGTLTYIVTTYGNPFTKKGFSNWFKKQCRAAGLDHCSAHGLRKAGATIAAMNGATAHELMAIYGWKKLSEAERYTQAVDKRTLLEHGMVKLDPPFDDVATQSDPPAAKSLK